MGKAYSSAEWRTVCVPDFLGWHGRVCKWVTSMSVSNCQRFSLSFSVSAACCNTQNCPVATYRSALCHFQSYLRSLHPSPLFLQEVGVAWWQELCLHHTEVRNLLVTAGVCVCMYTYLCVCAGKKCSQLVCRTASTQTHTHTHGHKAVPTRMQTVQQEFVRISSWMVDLLMLEETSSISTTATVSLLLLLLTVNLK